jgi:hypothetical protein
MENKVYYIYALVDPLTSTVRYIGCTTNPKSRRSCHLSPSAWGRKAKIEWTNELLAQNLKPDFVVLSTTNNIEEAAELEVLYYDLHDNGQLVCGNPKRHKYVKITQTPHLVNRNKKEVSGFFADNLKSLMKLNKVSLRELAAASGFKFGTLKQMINKEILFEPPIAARLTHMFSADQTSMITPNFEFILSDNKSICFYPSNRYSIIYRKVKEQ